MENSWLFKPVWMNVHNVASRVLVLQDPRWFSETRRITGDDLMNNFILPHHTTMKLFLHFINFSNKSHDA